MTENKRFTTVELPKPNRWGIWYDGAYLSTYQVCILLNEYVDVKKENEQLKKEKEFWKSDACSLLNVNSILSNELSIAQEQGYELSKPYKEYIASIKTEYDKFWKNKIKTHNNRLNGVRE